MRKSVAAYSIGVVGLIGGIYIGLIQSPPYISQIESESWKTPVDEIDSLILRGVIQSLDENDFSITANVVSPFTPNESMRLRVHYSSSTTMQVVPRTLQEPETFIQSRDFKIIDAEHLSVGSPVAIRIFRAAGTFRAASITIGKTGSEYNLLK